MNTGSLFEETYCRLSEDSTRENAAKDVIVNDSRFSTAEGSLDPDKSASTAKWLRLFIPTAYTVPHGIQKATAKNNVSVR